MANAVIIVSATPNSKVQRGAKSNLSSGSSFKPKTATVSQIKDIPIELSGSSPLKELKSVSQPRKGIFLKR